MDKQNKQLCLSLLNADSEREVIQILKDAGFWDDKSHWINYGNKENNFSIIGNQQGSADGALVEKLINSVDAILIKECKKRGIIPDSKDAPETINDALQKYFGIYNGKLSSVDALIRTNLAENISLIATGEKKNPSYIIIDKGEGQSPDSMPQTFLSLSESNKLRIPFVQGKFNMGSTGVLPFCGNNRMQLIISKKDPEVNEKFPETSSEYWGFTIVRRENPEDGMKSSVYRYLATQGKILRFLSDSLDALPEEYPKTYGKSLSSGSVIKLYEYQIGKGLKTIINFDLYNRLSLRLPNIALPIRLYERRNGYLGHSFESTLAGLNVRLEDDKRENIEDGFPSSSEMQIHGEKMRIQMYAFKPDKATKYAPKEGVVFAVNGQAHGFLPRSVFDKKAVGMSYLRDDILILVDCSHIAQGTREDLFMNSRDRLREGELKEEIEDQLEKMIKNHEGLRALKEKRRREDLEDMLHDSKPMADILNKIITKSPSLSKLFIQGINVSNPFNLVVTGKTPEYHGKQYPTYFSLKKKYPEDQPKECHINRDFRVQFETDVENDYFSRDNDQGEYSVTCDQLEANSFTYNLNLWNGVGTLTVSLPESIKEGDIFTFTVTVTDRTQTDPFTDVLYVRITKPNLSQGGDTGERPDGPSGDEGKDRVKPSGLSLPQMKECRKSEGESYMFRHDEHGALIVKNVENNIYDFYINMDNPYLLTEMKSSRVEPKLLESQFKIGMTLIGISILHEYEKQHAEEKNEEESVLDKIFFFTKSISPVLIPIIANLGNLELG
jgi:hypothetical protein